MKIIPISGIISNYEWEDESNVSPSSLRKSLQESNGEDILVTINSPGGGVFAGLEMFSLLKNYPGNVETRIVSLAASMGSVLALAGNKKSAENTALYFIHNAQSYASGDYRELAKESQWLRDISDLIANLYDEYTDLSFDEAVELMDADSQFFGNDLELLGFEIVNTGSSQSLSQARINAKMKFEKVYDKIKNDKNENNIERVAASIDFEKFGLKKQKKDPIEQAQDKIKEISGKEAINLFNSERNKIQNKAQNPATNAGKNKTEEKPMTLEQLMAENPAAKIELDKMLNDKFEAGKAEASKTYESRIEKASKFLDSEEYPKQIKDVAVNVIKGSNSIETLDTMVASVDMFREMNKSAQAKAETSETGETPGEQQPKLSENGEIKSTDDFMAEIAKAKNQSGVEVR